MSIRNLKDLFKPRSVAVIGASHRPGSVGATVLRNLVGGGYQGDIFPVNPKYDTLMNLPVAACIADLPHAAQLAIICTPAATVPALIAELSTRGTRAAIVLSAGLGAPEPGYDRSLKQAMLEAAKPNLLRVLGPNCVGLLVPSIGLNASFAHAQALPGKIAFVSQSGALVTGVLDWANSHGIGFSNVISLGESADIDFGDILNYLADDPDTHAMLLYVEDIVHARKFMSAARAAARAKPVLVIKAGRVAEGAKAAASHTGALAGSDAVYDAAIRRAGMLRVVSTEDLFNAVETLARSRWLTGERLAIVTNGGGPGVMATDALIDSHGTLATLNLATCARLDAVLPPTWSHANPVDIIGDAPVARYVAALEALLVDSQSDALLLIHAPTAIVPSAEIARALAPLIAASSRTVLACWLGGKAVAEARTIFADTAIPTYDTPEDAVHGFMQMVEYRRNQNLLMQVPPSTPRGFAPDHAAACTVIDAVLASGRTILSEPEAKAVLAAYGIPVVPTRMAPDLDAALLAAGQIGYPVALKIVSAELSHKSDVGGVVLDIETPDALRTAACAMLRRVALLRPNAPVQGFAIQAMARRPQAHELIVGMSCDPVFGPVILFGQGGVAVEVMADSAIGLPPLNMVLAREMIERTRVARLLAGYRDRPAANIEALCETLIRVAQLVADHARIIELDINPLLADSTGVIALDARMRVAPCTNAHDALDRFAIRPYPEALEQQIEWGGAPLTLRPLKPEDGPQHLGFFHALTAQDIRYRAFGMLHELQPAQLARLTQIDYDREMAFIATRNGPDGLPETLGVARAVADPDNINAEFAVIVRSDLKGQGLGTILMTQLIAYCRSRSTRTMSGEALNDNQRVLRTVSRLGFTISALAGTNTVALRLDLSDIPDSADPASLPAQQKIANHADDIRS